MEPTAERGPATGCRDVPFRILILGDFRGEGSGPAPAPPPGGPGVTPPTDPPETRDGPVAVDRDDFDQVLAWFAPRLRIPAGRDEEGKSPVEGGGDGNHGGSGREGPPTTLWFSTLDDFHPDRLYARAPALQPLRRWLEELRDPDAVREFAQEAGPEQDGGPQGPDEAGNPPEREGRSSTPRDLSGAGGMASLLDEILEGQGNAPGGERETGSEARVPDDLEAFIRQAVAPHLVPERSPDQARLPEEVEATVAGQLRHILHDPVFQALEALWRGVFLLVHRLETGPQLQVHLFQLPQADLAAALEGPVAESELRARLDGNEGSTGARDGWSLLVGGYSFGPGGGEPDLLWRLGALARWLGAPFLAAASPSTAEGFPGAGGGEAAEDWEAFRRTPEARWIGLALPRFLLRLPYGEEGDPCEALPFEEFGDPDAAPPHEHYLWGNSALLGALAMGRTFTERGWEGLPGAGRLLEGLPLDIRSVKGTVVAKPCAEVLLSEGELRELMDRGLIPVASRKEGGAVHLLGILSTASPPAHLAGRWMSAAPGGA